MVLNTTTPAEQESLWQLKNSWPGSKEPSQGKAVELRFYREDGSRPLTSLGASESHCSTWYFLKMATTISFVPMLFYNVIFYSPIKRLSLLLPDLWLLQPMEYAKEGLCDSQDRSQNARQHCLLEHFCFIQATFYKNEIYTVKDGLSCLCIFFLPLMYLCLSVHLLIHLSTYLIIYHLLSFLIQEKMFLLQLVLFYYLFF